MVLEGKDDEPTYSEAMSSPDRRKWEAAMKDEYDSLTENKTWTLIKESEVPSTHKPIDAKWVLKKKHDGRSKAGSQEDLHVSRSLAWTILMFSLASPGYLPTGCFLPWPRSSTLPFFSLT